MTFVSGVAAAYVIVISFSDVIGTVITTVVIERYVVVYELIVVIAVNHVIVMMLVVRMTLADRIPTTRVDASGTIVDVVQAARFYRRK